MYFFAKRIEKKDNCLFFSSLNRENDITTIDSVLSQNRNCTFFIRKKSSIGH